MIAMFSFCSIARFKIPILIIFRAYWINLKTLLDNIAILILVRYKVSGFREQGTGNREQGTGNREQGTGNREQGTGNREQGTGNGERKV
jgi:hypothetical protein